MTHSQRTKTMPLAWAKGMNDEEKKDFNDAWSNSTYVLDQLKRIIEELKQELALDTVRDYSNPNWQYVRADKNGQITALDNILKLLP